MIQAPGPFTDLTLDYAYETPRALSEFYVPVLSRTVRYDRTCGYFRASSLAVAAQGVARFLANGGRMRLLCGVELNEDEIPALQGDAPLPAAVEDRLKQALVTGDDIERHRLGVLAWLVREGRLDVALAIPTAPGSSAYFHEKQARFDDAHGNTVAISGSNNETASGWVRNFESFWVRASWRETPEAMRASLAAIEQRFEGDLGRFRRVALPEAVAREWVRLAPRDAPIHDIGEPLPRAARGTVARFLAVAPRLANGPETLAATTGVRLFPHQRENVERLVGTYPRSWLLADEVGLGKTISAGLALRELLLGGRVKRALVLAPANVATQWQDELFEKFGLWVPRFADQKLYGAHPRDIADVPSSANAFAEHDVLLVSSHLARRDAYRAKLLAAPAYDLIIVDEAHHARRKGANPRKREPSKLLRLLDEVRAAAHTKALWLLTATPMQVDPIELYDLLAHVADQPSIVGEDYVQFERYYKQLAQPLVGVAWNYLGRRVAAMPADLDIAEAALLERIGQRVGAYEAHGIGSWAHQPDPVAAAQAMSDEAREELRAFVRQRGPIARFVLRHGRQTLRRYRDAGLLKEPIAERSVTVRTVDFSPAESELYAALDDLIDRLSAAHATGTTAGFILTTYRRRLTSSWAAIASSLRRRVDAEAADMLEQAELDAVIDDELADDADDAPPVANPSVLPLTRGELEEMRGFVAALEAVTAHDGKLDALLADIDEARKTGRPIIVFTQYTDTLSYLRERLIGAYRGELAQYTGAGGRWFARPLGEDRTTKQELVEALRAAKITVLLCTDAASEGLNLQAASKLINYDLPWNPMRVEQRIGRIDRIGQRAAIVEIVNYTIPGTVEEDVYRALATRIDLFDGLVGELQPILGAVESSFKAIYRQPRSERSKIIREQIAAIDARRVELRRGGVGYAVDDDLWPPAPERPPAVDLAQFADALRDDLRLDLGGLPHPTTADPARASRDSADWRALATYGHPDIAALLATAAKGPAEPALVICTRDGASAAVRSDRSPPEPVESIQALSGLAAPVATDDAEQLAAELAGRIAVEREAALARWDVARSRRERAAMLAELERHLHRMLSLQILATGPAPADQLWSALISRPTPKICAQLPTVLARAGIKPNTMLDSYAPEQLELGDGDREMIAAGKDVQGWWMRWKLAAAV